MTSSSSPAAAGLSDRLRLAVLDNLADGVYFVDRQRRITYWNHGAERLTGFGAQEVVGRRCRDGILNHCDADGTELCGGHCPLIGTIQDGRVREVHIFLRHKEGYRRPVCVRAAPLRDETGHIIGAVEIFNDDSPLLDIRRLVADLERTSLSDALTGIGNRRLGDMTLAGWIEQQRQVDWSFGVLLADVDHFKVVNDTFGHDVGDEALRLVARTLAYCSRQTDQVIRWGGDEFVMLVAGVDANGLRADAERLTVLVARSTLSVEDRRIPLSVSIGGTLAAPGDTAASLLRRVDVQLYQAKTAGRNRVSLDVD
jgi:diguanylate cyclase (GGDEF)-like protein/PAS domain S-box-containing protein